MKVIAVVGVSGVGKTTFIKKASNQFAFQHLSAGSLISLEKNRRKEYVNRDGLRLEDILDNQELLIEGFHRVSDKTASLIILDGHTVIDTPQGLEPIPCAVFAKLKIDGIVFLKGDPSVILRQRSEDKNRNRPNLTVAQIAEQQERSLSITRDICNELSVPCEVVEAGRTPQLFSI